MEMQRTLHALEIHRVSKDWRSFHVWPDNPADKPCAKLPEKSQSWLDVRAGDCVLMKNEKTGIWQQWHVKAVKLFLVHPTLFNGQTVECGRAWLEGGD